MSRPWRASNVCVVMLQPSSRTLRTTEVCLPVTAVMTLSPRCASQLGRLRMFHGSLVGHIDVQSGSFKKRISHGPLLPLEGVGWLPFLRTG